MQAVGCKPETGFCRKGDCNPSLYKAYSHSKEPTGMAAEGKLPPSFTFSSLVKHRNQTAWAESLLLPRAAVALSPWTHNELFPSVFLYGLCLGTETAVLEEMYLYPFLFTSSWVAQVCTCWMWGPLSRAGDVTAVSLFVTHWFGSGDKHGVCDPAPALQVLSISHATSP